jgi:hypothetical protein
VRPRQAGGETRPDGERSRAGSCGSAGTRGRGWAWGRGGALKGSPGGLRGLCFAGARAGTVPWRLGRGGVRAERHDRCEVEGARELS